MYTYGGSWGYGSRNLTPIRDLLRTISRKLFELQSLIFYTILHFVSMSICKNEIKVPKYNKNLYFQYLATPIRYHFGIFKSHILETISVHTSNAYSRDLKHQQWKLDMTWSRWAYNFPLSLICLHGSHLKVGLGYMRPIFFCRGLVFFCSQIYHWGQNNTFLPKNAGKKFSQGFCTEWS